MKILAIETSCDETAISILEAGGGKTKPKFKVLAHTVSSQVALHAPYGGVVPMLAKREHGNNLIPLLRQSLVESGLTENKPRKRENLTIEMATRVREILDREPDLLDQFLQFIPETKKPDIDLIAVTQGPGLEPALWVGINAAKALALVWDLPLIPINHMEGHIASVLVNYQSDDNLKAKRYLQFPALALLISGGHTQLVMAKDWLTYKVVGDTRDDAVGEAFDKVARILGLPYPGGPEISRLAQLGTPNPEFRLPRPMINSGDFDFSFSGLKTAVLYLVKKSEPLSQISRTEIAYEFQQAAIDVLLHKTLGAIKRYKPSSLIIGGGVVSNQELQRQFAVALEQKYPKVKLLIPEPNLATDNATMIATAAYFHTIKPNPKSKTGAKKRGPVTADEELVARGTLALD